MSGAGRRHSLMHDIKWIRENPDEFDRKLRRRPLDAESCERFSSKALMAIDEQRRAVILKLETAQARRNAASKEIGEAKKKKDEARAQVLMAEVADLKTTIPTLEADAKRLEEELNGTTGVLATIPNLPLDEVPDGTDESGNVEHHHFGAKRNFAFDPKQHFDLGEALGMMDFETAAKLSGSRFVVLNRGLARMERALGQFMLDVHTSDPHNYTEVSPPLLVRDDAMFGTAQLPKFRADQFFSARLENTLAPSGVILEEAVGSRVTFVLNSENLTSLRDTVSEAIKRYEINEGVLAAAIQHLPDAELIAATRWLIPTAEVSLTNLVRESILDEAPLPLRFTALTPCFRAEAGAAGRDTRGMIRQHQFNKVELVSITTPENSKDEHERMLSCAEEVLRRLELHYRVVTLCAGDMGFASQKTYDIEVWLPGQGAYREISSCSQCGEFQARRMAARYRTKEGRQIRHVHTLNGSGTAVGRALVAVMENYQQGNGSIAVPDVLQPYMGGVKEIGLAP
jgi:seryl-tRNA synthetase